MVHTWPKGFCPMFSQADSKVCGPGESQRIVFRIRLNVQTDSSRMKANIADSA